MKKNIKLVSLWLIVSIIIIGCGGGGSNSTENISVGYLIDSKVVGVQYNTNSGLSGITDTYGRFNYKIGDEVTFSLGKLILGTTKPDEDGLVTPKLLVIGKNTEPTLEQETQITLLLQTLQSLYSDSNSSNGITINSNIISSLETLESKIEFSNIDEKKLIELDKEHNLGLDDNDDGSLDIDETDAKAHFEDSLENWDNGDKPDISKDEVSDIDKSENDEISKVNDEGEDEEDKDGEEKDDDEKDEDTKVNNTSDYITTGTYSLLAWNDLGMHCFDGMDFSVFSILPPYNNINAHLIKKDGTSNKHITSGVTLTYEALSYNGKINTSSSDKTNFWDYLPSLFPTVKSVKDVGLTGNKTPSAIPSPMSYNADHNWWEANAIPIVNKDDNQEINYYPMVRIVAKDSSGIILASADIVLPVSDEMDCAKCHASDVKSTDAMPIAGWEKDADKLKGYKYNILKLHDQNHPISKSDLDEVATKGYTYKSSLYETAKAGTPILCASCHSSNALGTTNVGNAKALTTAIHSKHATVIDPSNNLSLNSSKNRTSCYSCHPGGKTECLRGAMGSAKDANGDQKMQCQSCHGTMQDVGNTTRTGWLDQPNCQVCHQSGQRYESALVNGSLRDVVDNKFATTPNTPMAGVSLYRYSTGHGDLQCSSCHGSTHAIFPTSHAQDNIYSEKLQGHSGTVAECTSCHTTTPRTISGGPHGMHSVGQFWVDAHEDVAEDNSKQCTTCHGSDYRGSELSKTFSARTLNAEHSVKKYAKGDVVGCYDCHGREW